MTYSKVYLSLLFPALIACGHKNRENADSVSPPPSPQIESSSAESLNNPLNLKSTTDDPNILGSWDFYCRKDEAGEFSGSFYFDANSLSKRIRYSSKSQGCWTDLLYSIETISSYDFTAGQLKTKTAAFRVYVDSDEAAKKLNEEKACGISTWTRKSTLDVSNKDCTGSSLAPYLKSTKSGIESTHSAAIEPDGLERRKMTLDGQIYSHFIGLNEVKVPSLAEGGVTPVETLFTLPEALEYERRLKAWGCVLSREAGVSDCKAISTAEEGEYLLEALDSLLTSPSFTDPAFHSEAERVAVRYGLRKEASKIYATRIWIEAGWASSTAYDAVRKALPDITLSSRVEVGMLKRTKAYEVIASAAALPGLKEELARLKISHISINKASSIQATEIRTYSLGWIYSWTAEEGLAFLKSQPTPAAAQE